MTLDDTVCLWNNSIVVILLQVVTCSSYSVTLPSMYQFVTAPDAPPEEDEVGIASNMAAVVMIYTLQ